MSGRARRASPSASSLVAVARARRVRRAAREAAAGGPTSVLPTQVMAFGALYARHCAGCHGADGRLGAARPLNDPVYLALVPRERLRQVIAARRAGHGAAGASRRAPAATLTDAQIDALVQGLLWTWGRARTRSRDVGLPPYEAAAPASAERGQAVFAAACASCHGADGRGGPKGGSVVDPSYLALVSDQALRTTVIAGRPDLGMPDWRGDVAGQPLDAPADLGRRGLARRPAAAGARTACRRAPVHADRPDRTERAETMCAGHDSRASRRPRPVAGFLFKLGSR